MKIYDLSALAAGAASPKAGRPATALVHDSSDARIVLFRIEPGQAVPVHTNASTVLLTVISGQGTVTGAEGDRPVSAGDLVAYDPNEPHGMQAAVAAAEVGAGEPLVIAAVIAPRPGSR
jgi:quercetin dioxygenase-like cupin family protein